MRATKSTRTTTMAMIINNNPKQFLTIFFLFFLFDCVYSFPYKWHWNLHCLQSNFYFHSLDIERRALHVWSIQQQCLPASCFFSIAVGLDISSGRTEKESEIFYVRQQRRRPIRLTHIAARLPANEHFSACVRAGCFSFMARSFCFHYGDTGFCSDLIDVLVIVFFFFFFFNVCVFAWTHCCDSWSWHTRRYAQNNHKKRLETISYQRPIWRYSTNIV